jgi:hypothetical protein
MTRKKTVTPSDQPRPSKALAALRRALGLNQADWQEYLRHARHGFADYEQATWLGPKSTLRLRDVPTEWFEVPEALGYVAVRVLNKGVVDIATPVARHALRFCVPEPGSVHGPPGIGLAWLHLARQGLDPPVPPATLIHLALAMPKDFLQGVSENDLLPLSCLILEGRGTIEAWDLHALIIAVERARLSVRAPFRLFDDLMAADRLPGELKREFCRGLLACSPEAQRLKERTDALHASLHADPERMLHCPRMWIELIHLDLRRWMPVLQRHAVRALVEDIAEPLRAVLDEFFLRPDPDPQSANAVTQGALDLIGLHADELGPDEIRALLRKAIKRGTADVRQAAYRVGAERFGAEFARPALRDSARMVRDWAGKLLARNASKPGHEATVRRRGSPPDG